MARAVMILMRGNTTKQDQDTFMKILIVIFLWSGGIRHATADDFAVIQLQLSGTLMVGINMGNFEIFFYCCKLPFCFNVSIMFQCVGNSSSGYRVPINAFCT